MALNKVLLIGNAGKDPEVRKLENGQSVAYFSLATSERYKDKNGEVKDVTEWHNIVCWRGLADVVEKYVKKGMQLYIEGKIKSRSYKDSEGNTKYMTEIQADSLQMLEKRSSDNSNTAVPTANTSSSDRVPNSKPAITSAELSEDGQEDLPF